MSVMEGLLPILSDDNVFLRIRGMDGVRAKSRSLKSGRSPMSSTRSLFSSERQVLNVSDLLKDVFSGFVEVLVPVLIVPNEMLCSSGGRVNALVID